jgi:quercetin dioxygenase-like cupin family protein
MSTNRLRTKNLTHGTSRRQEDSAEPPNYFLAWRVVPGHEAWPVRGILGIVLLSAAVGCRQPGADAPRLVIGALRHGLDPHLEGHPLPAGTEIRADRVRRTPGASVHVVQVRGSERPHRHAQHDLIVQVLRGEGVLTLEGARITMRAGDAAVVERGSVHWFASAPGTTAVALVTFAPPLDAPDSVPLADVDSVDTRR